MPLIAKIPLCLLGWYVLGCVVLSSIDHEDQRLYHWACATPFGLYPLVILFWPILLIAYFWRKPW